MMTKKCNGCKILKDTSEFNTKPDDKGGRRLNYLCKLCVSNKSRERNQKIKNNIKTILIEKKCNKCKLLLPSEMFTKDNMQNSGLSKMCKDCSSQYYQKNKTRINESSTRSNRKNRTKSNLRKLLWAMKNKLKVKAANQKYYKNNIEKIKTNNKNWLKNNILAGKTKSHKYRAKKRNNTIQKFTTKQLEERMSVFDFKCAYCYGDFDHIDHVKPISKGGYHCLSNLRPSCKKCNLEKHNKSLNEWKIFKEFNKNK